MNHKSFLTTTSSFFLYQMRTKTRSHSHRLDTYCQNKVASILHCQPEKSNSNAMMDERWATHCPLGQLSQFLKPFSYLSQWHHFFPFPHSLLRGNANKNVNKTNMNAMRGSGSRWMQNVNGLSWRGYWWSFEYFSWILLTNPYVCIFTLHSL